MALTKAYQAVQASASNTATSTTTTGYFAIGYGTTLVCMVTNGATGPTIACSVYVDFATDGSGTNLVQSAITLGTAGVTNAGVYRFTVGLGVGNQGDAPYYRVRFTGNTAQTVTVQADAWTTTVI
jgi:hypothetical protein